MRIVLLSVLFAHLWTNAHAAIHDNVQDLLKQQNKFDFIVVGGGTAGNVVANRLSENPNHSVLVLEAGGSNEGELLLEAPLLCLIASPSTKWDWNYTTTPQSGLNDRTLAFPRGFVLGGSSSINYMVYTRGSKEDWDRMAHTADDERWSWDSLIPYMRRNEHFTQPADKHNTAGQFNPAVHGFTGVNSATLSGFQTEADDKVFAVTRDDPEFFPFNLDMNSGSQLGVGWTQMTALNGARSSSATSYLAPQFVARPNLQVLLNARVTRVLPTLDNDFRTVEFLDAKGQIFSLTAAKEVVLSAGSVNTPNILLHSGIGDATALSALGIKPLHNLPSVGANLTDHPLLPLAWFVDTNTSDTFDPIFQDPAVMQRVVEQWKETRTGRLTEVALSQLAWLRIPSNSTIFDTTPDPAAGPTTAHYEMLFSNGFVGPTPDSGKYFGITLAVVSPAARGSVSLASADPLAPPRIDPNILGAEIDLVIMREALKAAFRFAAQPSLASYITGEPPGLSSTFSDAQLDAFIRANGATIFHPVGTAGMSPVGASWGVVDPDLRVKGVKGLRVADCSVIPLIPAAHTQAPAYIVGERAADFIKEDW
ncbi:Alcohol oxidase [Mycena kentingensis (nom. inval.)]|nr:Alcohol oxidase [Mycena kentingensis (nom. inval.)]